MRTVLKFLSAVMFNCMTGAIIAIAIGADMAWGAAAMAGTGVVMGFVPTAQGVLREGVYTEVWAGELIKKLRSLLDGSWLDGIPDQSSIVENDAIHLVKVGVDPDVLVNNTTYPIPSQKLDDEDVVIRLDKFQTKRTPVTDDELYAISYDKMARVKESHGNAINDCKFAKAAHSLCAKQNTVTTPVLKTTGEADPTTGRRRLTFNDLIELKRAMDNLGAPQENRRLVLCPDHVNDLLLVSQAFQQQFNIDRNTGKIGHLAGFDIYTYKSTPVYTAAGEKKAFGATAKSGEFNCSFAFYTPRVFKATGSTRMYYREAAISPDTQESEVNFRHYFICMPKAMDAGVVMMSGSGPATAAEALSLDEPYAIPVAGDDTAVADGETENAESHSAEA